MAHPSLGLRRFLREEYASKYLEAGMIGYVQCDTTGLWMDQLKRCILDDAKKKCELRLVSSPQNAQIYNAIPEEWSSVHVRDSGKEIAIYHMLLDYCSKEFLS